MSSNYDQYHEDDIDKDGALLSFPIDSSGSFLRINDVDVLRLHSIVTQTGFNSIDITDIIQAFRSHAEDDILITKDGFDAVSIFL